MMSVFSSDGHYEYMPPQSIAVYAGFWARVWAALIDHFFLFVAESVLAGICAPKLAIDWQATPSDTEATNIVNVAWTSGYQHSSLLYPHIQGNLPTWAETLMAVLIPAYFILFQSSRMRATPGKRVLGLEITTLSGEQISILRAAVRFVIKAGISIPFLCIGVLIIPFTRRKQALHDLVAGTLVIKRDKIAHFSQY